MKRRNKIYKKMALVFMIVALVSVAAILPIIKAEQNTSETIVLTFVVEDSTKYELAIEKQNSKDRLVVIRKSDNAKNTLDFVSNGAGIGEEVDYACENSTRCTMTMEKNGNRNNVGIRYDRAYYDLTYNDGENDVLIEEDKKVFVADTQIDIKEPINQGGQGGQGESNFDGKAVVVWSCGTGDNGVCYHEFDDIQVNEDGSSVFYSASQVEADNKPGTFFNVHAEYKEWYLKSTFDSWVTDYEVATGNSVNWDTLDPELIAGAPVNMGQYEEGETNCTKPNEDAHWSEWNTYEACVNSYAATQGVIATRELKPVGEPTDNNAYVSYGDRNFKVVIYNDEYRGVTFGSLDDLHYYPSEWTNPFLRQDQFDISGTSEDNPATINTILLESTVNIKELNPNGFSINAIEALNVPEGAVSINKVSGEWKLVFSSNYYDNVLFRATDSNGVPYYFNVKRYTIDAWINNVEGKPHYYAEFYFDNTKSYNDFVLTAKIEYKDGTTQIVTLTPYNKIEDGLGHINDVYEIDESIQTDPNVPTGKGLKKAVFIYKLPNGKTDRDIKRAYTTAEYKGSTANNYAGAFAGSGKGVLANIYQGDGE